MRKMEHLALVALNVLFALAPVAGAQEVRRPRLVKPAPEPLAAEQCEFARGPALCASPSSATLNLHDRGLLLHSDRPISTDGRRRDAILETLTLEETFETRDGLSLAREETRLGVRIEVCSAGTVRQSCLAVKLEKTMVTVTDSQMILIGRTAGGEPVYLKPGAYDLQFSGVLSRIQTDSRSFTGDPETGRVAGGKFRRSYPYDRTLDDPYLEPGAARFPAGSLLMDMGKSAIGVFSVLLRRPEIRIPARSSFYFNVDSLTLSPLDVGAKPVYVSK